MTDGFTKSEEKKTKGTHLELRFKQVPEKGQVPGEQGATDKMGKLLTNGKGRKKSLSCPPRATKTHTDDILDVTHHLSSSWGVDQRSSCEFCSTQWDEVWWGKHSRWQDRLPKPGEVRYLPRRPLSDCIHNPACSGHVFRRWIISTHFYYYPIFHISAIGNKSTVLEGTASQLSKWDVLH